MAAMMFPLPGPMARLRPMQDSAYLPEVSVGYYGKFGDDAVDQQAAFLALYKRIPIGNESGFVRSASTVVRAMYGTRRKTTRPSAAMVASKFSFRCVSTSLARSALTTTPQRLRMPTVFSGASVASTSALLVCRTAISPTMPSSSVSARN